MRRKNHKTIEMRLLSRAPSASPVSTPSTRLSVSYSIHPSSYWKQMGENGVLSESLDEWEQIETPFILTTSTSIIAPQSRKGYKPTPIRHDYSHDCSSIFPPRDHEDLPISAEENPKQPSGRPASPSPQTDEASPSSLQRRGTPKVADKILQILRMRYEHICSKVCAFASAVYREGGFWSIVSAAGLAGALLTCWLIVKVQRWRRRIQKDNKDQLMMLIREKDEKINRLLRQIAQMNEMLSARRRVPVVQIGWELNMYFGCHGAIGVWYLLIIVKTR